jgi:hypothetical protein
MILPEILNDVYWTFTGKPVRGEYQLILRFVQWYIIHVLNPWGVSFDTDMFLGQMYAIRGEYRTILTSFGGTFTSIRGQYRTILTSVEYQSILTVFLKCI